MVAAVLVVAIVIGFAASGVGRDSSSIAPATRSRQLAVDHPQPPVPEGWKPVTFGPVQFSVPQDWPVYDDGRCNNHSTVGVYLGRSNAGCSGTFSAITVDVLEFVGDGSEFPTATTINGLTALTREPDGIDGHPDRYTVALPDEDVIIEVSFLASADRTLAAQIVDTIGAAPNPQPIPEAAPPPVPTTKPGPSDFCSAVQDFTEHGVDSSAWNGIGPQAQPYFERIRDAAPAELRPPLDTLIAWLEDGRPQPAPAEVAQAALQTTKDWIARCAASTTATPATQPTVQVLNASTVQGAATALTSLLQRDWPTVPPGNAPAVRDGTVLQCKRLPGGVDGDVLVAQVDSTLRQLGYHPAPIEPVPNPLPAGYDPAADCYVVLGR